MIVTLPKKFVGVADIEIPTTNPLFKITLIKGGLLIYNMAGVLIGQVFVSEHKSTAVIADGATVQISISSQGNYTIAPATIDKADKKKIFRIDSEKKLLSEFIIFGCPRRGNYQLFEKPHNQTKPILMATVVPSPLEDTIKIKLEESTNLLQAVTLISAITIL